MVDVPQGQLAAEQVPQPVKVGDEALDAGRRLKGRRAVEGAEARAHDPQRDGQLDSDCLHLRVVLLEPAALGRLLAPVLELAFEAGQPVIELRLLALAQSHDVTGPGNRMPGRRVNSAVDGNVSGSSRPRSRIRSATSQMRQPLPRAPMSAP